MSQKQDTIHLAMAAILKDIQAIAKDRKNESQGFRFRGIDDCYNMLHPIFAAHGVVCAPMVEKLDLKDFLNAKGNRVFHTHVTMRFHFTAADGTSMQAMTVGEGMDHGDKSTAKAMSVAHKYLLLQTFLIPTADIADGDQYDPTIDPHEQLRAVREENAKVIVMEAVAKGENPELPIDAVEKLERKRKELEARIASGQGSTANAPVVSSATPAPQETQTGPSEAPSAENGPDTEWNDWVIQTVDKAPWHGTNLAEMKIEDLRELNDKWAVKFWDKIQKNPAKLAEAIKVKEAFAARKHELGN